MSPAPRPEDVVRALLDWYAAAGRHDLPWRRDRAAYRVVVSEFMLQQTQVDRVVPLFEAFVARWPDVRALAEAALAEVVRAWKGLGYNSRAVRLHALARAVAARPAAEMPRETGELAALPGVGPYTLAAIRAFAFDEPVVAIDTNLRRILHRVAFGVEWPPLASAAELERFGQRLATAAGGGFALNSALMDLGATVCTARTPKCLVCPLRSTCEAAPIDPGRLAVSAAAHAPKRGPQARLVFAHTTRYLRGRIVDRLREIDGAAWLPVAAIDELGARLDPPRDPAEVATVLAALVAGGLVERGDGVVRLRH